MPDTAPAEAVATASPTAEPVLSVRNLSVSFPGRRGVLKALDDISFDLAPGEILGMVGESGAGKSMTGLAVQRLLEPPGHISGGEVHLLGARIDQLPESQMERLRGKQIGAIFQDPLTSLNPLFTVGHQIAETIRVHLGASRREAMDQARDLLRRVGIPSPDERVNHYPHQFSGGMRQRVVIALALAAQPRLIIADEPTTALDVSIQAQIMSLLRRLCDETGVAMLLVTHDMGVIAQTADRIAVMYAGRLIELAPVQEVLRQPRHPYTRGLIGAIPALRKRVPRLTQIDGSMPRLDAIPPGCAFNPRCPDAGPRCRVDRPELTATPTGIVACWMNAGGVT
ncbi:ABC transporter ATP-binding protein [Rhodobacteraceae bacterium 2376]|uniref:ABC transporter ATP-binding protein n=1 Tax=Rhabdonatronobacter sediminivivens TaxID=2743469 RepID=A0A7Z0KXN5_9RHOB|nr:ABC transporter ATP-binding protein [Rhabdonatronobacter sediminivivens]NYS24560.1 ABC transporter ATP-binding protein [Rhabdonatronobacter sediminivivens]